MMAETTTEALTAAGHEGAQQGEGIFIKPSCEQEVRFYQWLVTSRSSLYEFVPKFMGTLYEGNTDTVLNQANSPETKPLLVLEDLCHGFSQASVMDVKLGKILWDSDAPLEKQNRLRKVSNDTTSGSIGFRIAGINYINANGDREKIGKHFGREANENNVISYLKTFWPKLDNNYIFSCLVSIVTQLNELFEVLKTENVELHSASVLLIYEGDVKALEAKASRIGQTNMQLNLDTDEEQEIKIVDVRLIDFAHTKNSDQPDKDTLGGLAELIRCLQDIVDSFI